MGNCGIGAIINNINNKHFIFKSNDLDQRIDNFRLQLDMDCHYNHELQRDWNELGSENFSFETREITLNDESELNSRLKHHISICRDTYNENDIKKLFKGELPSKIEILTNKLHIIAGEKEFTRNFREDLERLNLTHDEGEKFISLMIDKIKSDEINYYNFDSKFESILNDMSVTKQKNIEMQKKENLLDRLHSITGLNTHSQIYNKMLEDHNLGSDIGFSIRIELEEMISREEITSNFEIDKNLDEILKREQAKKMQYENNKKMALKKLYALTGDHVPKAQFIYKLNSLGLSIDDGNLIKKEIERKIELNEISFAQVEFEFEKEIENKVNLLKKESQNRKSALLNALYEIVGDSEIPDDFKNRLASHDLHENIAFQIQNKLKTEIENDSIESVDELNSKINEIILKKEREDVEVRLNDLSKNEIDDILKMNSVNSPIPFKSTKIVKLLNVVPLNIIKQNLKELGHDVDVTFKVNPNIIFCIQCGSENTSDSVYCSECGAKLE